MVSGFFCLNYFDLNFFFLQKRLPDYANRFIEICLMLTADHGPAVSGAHNTIVCLINEIKISFFYLKVCARAGKDLISSLVSGLLTIVYFFIFRIFICFLLRVIVLVALWMEQQRHSLKLWIKV